MQLPASDHADLTASSAPSGLCSPRPATQTPKPLFLPCVMIAPTSLSYCKWKHVYKILAHSRCLVNISPSPPFPGSHKVL